MGAVQYVLHSEGLAVLQTSCPSHFGALLWTRHLIFRVVVEISIQLLVNDAYEYLIYHF